MGLGIRRPSGEAASPSPGLGLCMETRERPTVSSLARSGAPTWKGRCASHLQITQLRVSVRVGAVIEPNVLVVSLCPHESSLGCSTGRLDQRDSAGTGLRQGPGQLSLRISLEEGGLLLPSTRSRPHTTVLRKEWDCILLEATLAIWPIRPRARGLASVLKPRGPGGGWVDVLISMREEVQMAGYS